MSETPEPLPEPSASDTLSQDESEPAARTKEWVYFQGGADGSKSPVLKEIRKEKLSVPELARIQDVMDRVRAGETMPKDVKDLGDGVLEFKIHLDRRSYRMAYAEVDGGFVLLALTFFRKTQQRQRNDVERAKTRLKTYLQGSHDTE